MSVVTQGTKAAHWLSQKFDLLKYFDGIVASAEHAKPYPDPILLAAHKMNTAENCLMIGDTTVDIHEQSCQELKRWACCVVSART